MLTEQQTTRRRTCAPTSVNGASAADGGPPYSPRRIMVSRKFTPATLRGGEVGRNGGSSWRGRVVGVCNG